MQIPCLILRKISHGFHLFTFTRTHTHINESHMCHDTTEKNKYATQYFSLTHRGSGWAELAAALTGVLLVYLYIMNGEEQGGW